MKKKKARRPKKLSAPPNADLMTYTLPASSLNSEGKAIHVTAWGTSRKRPA